jgi:DNA-binding response OmpR family regulator
MTEPLRLVVVDDDELQLELMERALSREGFEVARASSGKTLAIEAKRIEPHIVLVDVNMPDEPADRIIAIAREAAPSARVFLYSAWDLSRLRAISAELGADGFISKSESVALIGTRIRELYAR